ncbi:hypothetical protein VTJ49DRAFT_1139 [Mycothermus thermophilus]|uniref:RING-type E3 ubiquitin transferase n=1 Tax=Humicola insolens TaxID=85995 RepID=A0ABR3VNY4_HUMIN
MTSNGVNAVPTNQPPGQTIAAMDGFPLEPFPPPDDPVRFPNTRRRPSVSFRARPRTPSDPSPADPDTCRICRGEATPEEPLFYPCKCSGSIKYVHQDCLMEWLSHSQKKHCELCKTPFRFTKLYDPDMPANLPFPIFVRHTAKYLARALLVWLRAALVANVWLGWLPYLMRAVWSFLFWISDEGLGPRPSSYAASVASDALDRLSGALPLGLGVCPTSPLLAETAAATTPATLAGVLESLPPASAKFVRGLFSINLTSTDPVYASVLRLLFGSGADPDPIPRPEVRRRSLLSGVAFLQNLTRHPSVNRAIVDVLEGQIITVLVIVSFILIILVRDYVVQQQPEINMRAFAEDPLVAPAQPLEDAHPQPQPEHEVEAVLEPAPEPESSGSGTVQEAHDSATRPLPSLDDVTEQAEYDRAGVHEYLNIYREAGGDPDKILRMARERNLDGRLDYWMRLTRSMMDRADADPDDQQHSRAAMDSLDGVPGPSSSQDNPSESDQDVGDLAMGVRLRPRAHTDGPTLPRPVHPLANNNWSFNNLPTPGPSESDIDTIESLPATLTEPEEPPQLNAPQEAPHTPPQTEPTIQPAPPRPPRPGLSGRLLDFMWREVEAIPEDELANINRQGDFGEDDPEEEAAANQEAMEQDPDAPILDDDEAEDLEGVLELLGVRGQLVGLFQNALFCAFLVSITIFLGVFVPYNIGRVTIWAVANPSRIVRIMFGLARLIQDFAVLTVSFASMVASGMLYVLGRFLMLPRLAGPALAALHASWATATTTVLRVNGAVDYDLPLLSPAEVRNFSAISHEALQVLKHQMAASVLAPARVLGLLGGEVPGAAAMASAAWLALKNLPSALHPGAWLLDLGQATAPATVDGSLSHWGAADRFWAIMAGYLAVSLAAALYLKRGVPLSTAPAAQDWEASLLDALHQASGVVKVILIISIEMLVFPLYCGLLLDVALLPLFENATLQSRVLFTMHYPVTSVFVHWFIGTAYMFHFALFVSMCRKIMRKGVLHFIRDPDDPEFHPVRDVLERTVATQLRKILFSAFVYGALVIICLGGVVWGLALALPGTLPIHYSSDEPVLEFPVDLLFYNFAMPLAVKFFRPSAGLHAMYTWWFRRCARALRITWFLFGEWRVDEEGQLVLRPDSPDRKLPFWRRWFLEVAEPNNNVVARSWRGILEGGAAPRDDLIVSPESSEYERARTKASLVRSGQLIPDGRFVRAPASGQVKIPKGARVFLEVTEDNVRLDGRPDVSLTDVYSTDQYQLVYIPPNFRLRISVFILLIWLFAAATGVGMTIVPLAFGRWMLRGMLPPHVRTNDVYAFSVGVHVLGLAAYLVVRASPLVGAVWERVAAWAHLVRREGVPRVMKAMNYTLRLVYFYTVVFGVFPMMISSLMELYALMPLHEVLYGNSLLLRRSSTATATAHDPGTATAASTTDLSVGQVHSQVQKEHTVRLVQAWTLGLVYLKLATRITNTWFKGGKLSNASRAVMRRGWTDPDCGILTRAFVVPGLVLWTAAVVGPLVVARTAVAQGVVEALVRRAVAALAAAGGSGGEVAWEGEQAEEELRRAFAVVVYRLSFPVVALTMAGILAGWSAVGVARRWKGRIRDEAYLIGERLHNFGASNAPRPRGAWTRI